MVDFLFLSFLFDFLFLFTFLYFSYTVLLFEMISRFYKFAVWLFTWLTLNFQMLIGGKCKVYGLRLSLNFGVRPAAKKFYVPLTVEKPLHWIVMEYTQNFREKETYNWWEIASETQS